MNGMLKFFAVWFAATVLAGLALAFTHGDPSTLNPANESLRLEQCEAAEGTFSGSTQQDCVEGVEAALQRDAEDAASDLMTWFGVASLGVLIIGGIFMSKIRARAKTAGTRSEFRSLRQDWFLYLALVGVLAIIAGVFAHGGLFGAWAPELAPMRRWADLSLLTIVWAATYIIGTKLATPHKMQPSIPF